MLLQQELKELEEKFRKAMVQNAQLDNEKGSLVYQVELYKDKLEDMEEAYSLLQVEFFKTFFCSMISDFNLFRKSIKRSTGS